MKELFVGVEISREPQITGDRNGGFQVESKWVKSFRNKEEREYYCEVLRGGSFDNYGFSSFPLKIDTEKLHLPITFYADRKSTKETEFISFAFRLSAIQFIISEKSLDLLKQYRLPPMVVVDCCIVPKKENTFLGKYYLVGFAALDSAELDYAQSIFTYLHDEGGSEWRWQDMPAVASEDDYKEFTENQFCSLVRPKQIILKDKYHFDVVNAREHGLFFSERLIQSLKEQDCWLGLDSRDCTLRDASLMKLSEDKAADRK